MKYCEKVDFYDSEERSHIWDRRAQRVGVFHSIQNQLQAIMHTVFIYLLTKFECDVVPRVALPKKLVKVQNLLQHSLSKYPNPAQIVAQHL